MRLRNRRGTRFRISDFLSLPEIQNQKSNYDGEEHYTGGNSQANESVPLFLCFGETANEDSIQSSSSKDFICMSDMGIAKSDEQCLKYEDPAPELNGHCEIKHKDLT